MTNKRCPLMAKSSPECLGPVCAWWVDKTCECAILFLAAEVGTPRFVVTNRPLLHPVLGKTREGDLP